LGEVITILFHLELQVRFIRDYAFKYFFGLWLSVVLYFAGRWIYPYYFLYLCLEDTESVPDLGCCEEIYSVNDELFWVYAIVVEVIGIGTFGVEVFQWDVDPYFLLEKVYDGPIQRFVLVTDVPLDGGLDHCETQI
jgi:hypothetical protein